MIPRQMNSQTQQIQQSWTRNNMKKPIVNKKKTNVIYKKTSQLSEPIDHQLVEITRLAKQQTLENKLMGDNSANDKKIYFSKSSNMALEDPKEKVLHRQLKTFYGQSQPTQSRKSAANCPFSNQREMVNKNYIEGKMAAPSGSTSVGANRTGISLGEQVSATSGWSTSLANEKQ